MKHRDPDEARVPVKYLLDDDRVYLAALGLIVLWLTLMVLAMMLVLL